MTGIFAEQTVEVVKSAIETADGALDLYNKYLDQVIPWKTFDETIKELSRFKQMRKKHQPRKIFSSGY